MTKKVGLSWGEKKEKGRKKEVGPAQGKKRGGNNSREWRKAPIGKREGEELHARKLPVCDALGEALPHQKKKGGEKKFKHQ